MAIKFDITGQDYLMQKGTQFISVKRFGFAYPFAGALEERQDLVKLDEQSSTDLRFSRKCLELVSERS